ncbi:hypothetical protein [Nocardia shimofusensis]|uniref:hypothetical protein n=1 Tax=Nocardia shimofusensis TaxID=228596 RepID=UPI00083742C7|nr:hypothetical protein [Nocardia shimofusensis]
MKRSVLLIAATATAAAVLTACGGEDASDKGSAASTTVSTSASAPATTPGAPVPGPDAGTAAPAPETTVPAPEATVPAPEPTVPGDTGVTESPAPSEDHCAVVTDEYLITSLRMTGPPNSLVPLQDSRCTGTFASANNWPEGALHPELYLFQYSEAHGHWRFIEHGYGGMDCAGKYGLSPEAASILRC